MGCEEIARLEECTEYSMADSLNSPSLVKSRRVVVGVKPLPSSETGFPASNGTQGSESNLILARKRKKMKKIRT
jgi:hypothetical protein